MYITISRVLMVIGLLFLGMMALPTQGLAQDQTDRAWLRIETGAHTARLADAATDPAGRVLVTASEDKTARIWSLPDLRPLGVLRPPIGSGNEGALYAVAVSPDGKTAAVGGFTSAPTEPANVYIFDLATKAIIRRLTGLPNAPYSLAFAPDGRLAAGLAGSNGVRIWRDKTLLFQDPNWIGDVYGLTFARDGRLAAASIAGTLRLYDAAGVPLQTTATEAGRQPIHLRFSPDGMRLAVGFNDIAALQVWDGRTLMLQTRPDVTGLDGSSLPKVAWSRDGRTVFGGGNIWDGSSKAIFAWDLAGQGKRRTAAAGFSDNIGEIVPLPDGALAITSFAGDIAVAAQDGMRRHDVRPPGQYLATARDQPTHPSWRLRLSGDGIRVEWVTAPSPNRLLLFDSSIVDLSVGNPAATGLTDWADKDNAVRVSAWDDRADPKLNNNALTLQRYESSRSVSVGNHRVLVGTDFYLRMFDGNGKPIWPQPVSAPGTAWRVNQSQDGRLAVAAFGDSTIRWYRADNGQELLALMVTEDAQRWVAFTPSGYYAAGPGSENLIGWHVNRGPDRAADFFPASRFRDKFYRPDVVKLVLDTLDEAEALRRADAALGPTAGRNGSSSANAIATLLRDRPPVATIVSPRDGTTLTTAQAELQVRIRSPTGRPITRVEARIDGRPAPGALVSQPEPIDAPAPERAERRTITVTLAQRQSADVEIIAWSDDRASEAATVHLFGPPPSIAPTAEVPDLSKPRLNAVLVGISHYQDTTLALKFAAKDASDLAAALRRQQGGLYREVNVHLVPEAAATRDKILGEILWLRHQTIQRDLAILFLAGHGVAEDVEYYFLTVDADPDAPSLRGLPGTQLRTQLRQIPGRTVALLDTCYAGALIGGFRDLPLDISKLVAELSDADTGVAVYSATTNRQRAAELEALHNGIFTSALLDVLNGRYGQAGQAPIRVNSLASLLAERVRVLSDGHQASTYNALDPIRDIPLFVAHQ